MKTYRLARVEKLVHDLKFPEEDKLRKLKAYDKFCEAVDEFVKAPDKKSCPNRWWSLLRSIASLIQEAMEDK